MNDTVRRARRDYDRERTAAWKHVLCCAWCDGGPCPMGRAVRENAQAYGRHLADLTRETGR